MSYNRYSYTSPSGRHSYGSTSYQSPSGNSRYSSTSSYDRYGSGSTSNYGSSSTSNYGSGLTSSYGGSLSNLSSSRYSSPYTATSSPYVATSNRYSGDYSSYTPSYSKSYYTPSSSSSSSYSRSKYLTDSTDDYVPRYTKPSYETDYVSKYRSTESDSSYTPRKVKFDDSQSDYKPAKKAAAETKSKPAKSESSTSTKSESSTSTESRRSRREKKEEVSAVPDVTSVTRQTESLKLDNGRVSESIRYQAPQAPQKPVANESARYQEQNADHPNYKGYTNPNLQSNSFKTLQNVIDSGQDAGSFFQKAPWQSQTVNQVSNEPRKYTPTQTWAAVQAENGRSGVNQPPGSHSAPSAGPFHVPTAPPAPVTNRAPSAARPTAPPHQVNNMKNFGQQMHAPQNNSFMFDVRTPSPAANKGNKSTESPSKITQIPHGDGIATKGKSAMNQNTGSDKIPQCAKCNSDIRGPFVLALNKSWCPHHFTCDKCNSELVNMGFVELNGKIYCENDYEAFFAPKCGKCRKAIVGDTVNALDKAWHPTCFVCNECNSPISSGAFHVENGLPYCISDWQRLFQIKCSGCTYPVEPGDKWIEALNANWHAECFVCGTCKVQLEGQPFYPQDGKPFCRAHVRS